MISIKNWHRFQHFKDRRPPWIKLYRDLLDDDEWFELDPLASKTLVMLWLIASEDNGNLPCVKKLAFRLRKTVRQVETTLCDLSHWLIRDDIVETSCRCHDDTPETETYKEEKEAEKRETRFAPPTLEEVSQYCQSRNNQVDPVKFHAFYSSKGWKVGRSPMKDWRACVVTWERGN